MTRVLYFECDLCTGGYGITSVCKVQEFFPFLHAGKEVFQGDPRRELQRHREGLVQRLRKGSTVRTAESSRVARALHEISNFKSSELIQGSHHTWKNRARPGKPKKPGKIGGLGAKTWKNITKPGKKIDLTPKKPKSLNRKSI